MSKKIAFITRALIYRLLALTSTSDVTASTKIRGPGCLETSLVFTLDLGDKGRQTLTAFQADLDIFLLHFNGHPDFAEVVETEGWKFSADSLALNAALFGMKEEDFAHRVAESDYSILFATLDEPIHENPLFDESAFTIEKLMDALGVEILPTGEAVYIPVNKDDNKENNMSNNEGKTDKVADVINHAAEKVAGAASATLDAAGEVLGAVGDKVKGAADAAADVAEDTAQRIDQEIPGDGTFFQDNRGWICGVGGFVAGVLVGWWLAK